jgi:hypothetical protein
LSEHQNALGHALLDPGEIGKTRDDQVPLVPIEVLADLRNIFFDEILITDDDSRLAITHI